jgi:hypothetical protein
MSAPVLAAPRETFPAAPPGLTITAVGAGLWRVARPGGPVLGHIELRTLGAVERYSARRLVAGGIRSTPLGEFWSAADAAECFR